MKSELNQRMIKLLLHIKKNGFVMKDTRPFLSALRYYNYLWALRDMSLIECNGVDKNTQQKKWVLSEKGIDVAGKLKNIEDLISDES